MKLHPPFMITALLTSVLGRSWTPRDPCPSTIKTLIPGGNDPLDHYTDEDEETRDSQNCHGPDHDHDHDHPVFPSMSSVHSALTTCPGITSLDLRVTLLGCSEWPDRWNFPFSPSGDDHYPSLTTLRLDGYRGLAKRPYEESDRSAQGWIGRMAQMAQRMASSLSSPSSSSSSSTLPETQRNKTNLDLWLDAMDFSQLHTLGLSGMTRSDTTYFLNKTSSHLTSLDHLELDKSSVESTLSFLRSLSESNTSLTRLKWTGLQASDFSTRLTNLTTSSPSASTSTCTSDILSTIVSCQPALQHLDMHTVETLHATSPTIPLAQLCSLRDLPRLAHLSLNLPRNGTWPAETLLSLSSLPNLTSLDLWLDIASPCRRQMPDRGAPWRDSSDDDNDGDDTSCKGAAQFQTPYVNEATALDVFSFLRANKAGRPLTNLTLWAGDWSRPWDGPLYTPPWIEGRQAKVTCGVAGAADATGSDVQEDCHLLVGQRYWESRSYGWMDDYL
ncbi:hypothetical protein RBB50_002703 [Rhinocladiella similis]